MEERLFDRIVLTLSKNCILIVENFESCLHPFLGMFLCCIVLYSI